MALSKIRRHRVPNDGTVIRTTANLNRLMRAVSRYDDDIPWARFCDETWVPVFLRMALYQAQKTRDRPDGMIYGPIVRVGCQDSPEVVMHGHHHAAGLFYDGDLDGWDTTDKWMYQPLDEDPAPPGEDVSQYECSICNEFLYRDDDGLRQNKSACLNDGSLVCRGCEMPGLIARAEERTQIARCRRLAAFLQSHYGTEHVRQFDRQIEVLRAGFTSGRPAQTRLANEDRYSFGWSSYALTPEGPKFSMNGGLIQHGPHPLEGKDGSFTFTTWDDKAKKQRDANEEEIKSIAWSLHT